MAPGAGEGRGAVWRPFVAASILYAASAGFLLGAVLFAVRSTGRPLGAWWPAAAQAHGHIQLFGFAGLMVLGVAFHFLPRLRGAPLARPRLVPLVFVGVAGGLLLRGVAQPLAAAAGSGGLALAWRVGVLLSAALELAGVTLALVMLVETLGGRAPARKGTALRPIAPFLALAAASLWLGLAANLVGTAVALGRGEALLPSWIDRLVVDLAFLGFLVPMSVAMSVRTFPLYFQTSPPRERLLLTGLGLLVIGLGARLAGDAVGAGELAGDGRLVAAGALVLFPVGLGLFDRRRPLPRRSSNPLRDPLQLHAISAYLWLLGAAVLAAIAGFAQLGLVGGGVRLDAERHALGAGFVLLLILGVGGHLLPGFARRPLRSRWLVWATLALANLAALLRVLPVLAGVDRAVADPLLALGGVAGLLALGCFALNIGAGRAKPGRAASR